MIEVEFPERVIDIQVEVEEYYGGGGAELPYYEGPYEITPNTKGQVLDTFQKVMKKDVSILAIPFSEVHNQEGLTVIIGGE